MQEENVQKNVTRTPVSTLDSHNTGFPWTVKLTLYIHANTNIGPPPLHVKPHLNKCVDTHNHLLIFTSCFIFLNILTNKPPLCLPLPSIPQTLCPTALQQHLISLLFTVCTMHALVELIEVSEAHHTEMGAMCCAVCQPLIHV